LIRVIDKMLAKEPEDRYQTPDEVVEALEPWTRTPIEPPSPEELPLLSKAARASSNPSSVRMPMPSIKSMVAHPNRRSGSTSKSRISTSDSSTTRARPASHSSIDPYEDEEAAPPIRRGRSSRFPTNEIPWFKQPRNIAVIAAGVVGILGLGAWGFSGSKKDPSIVIDAPNPVSRSK
jgi:serine/threonine protein kinase